MKKIPLSLFIILAVLLSVLPVHAMDAIWTYSTAGTKIESVSVSADGSAIAVGAEKVLLFSKNGELLAKEPYGDKVLITPNGGYLLSSFGSSLYFFQRDATKSSFQKKWDYELPMRVRSIDMSDDGKIIVASSESRGTYIFSSAGKLTGGNGNYSALVRVSPDGQRILGASTLALCRYSSTGTGTCFENASIGSVPDVMEMTGGGATVVFNDDQRLLSVATSNGVKRWNARATADITALAMIPSGSKILVGTQNGNVDLFDDKGNRSWSYATNPAGSPGSGVKEVALSTDGKIAAAGTYEGTVVVLDAGSNLLWSNVTKDHISHIAMSGDGSLVIAAGDETVYAFSSSSQPIPTVRSSQVTTGPVQQKNTSIPATTAPQKTAETSRSTPREITSVPTTYSVIRTATQGPVSPVIPLLGVLGAVYVFLKRR